MSHKCNSHATLKHENILIERNADLNFDMCVMWLSGLQLKIFQIIPFDLFDFIFCLKLEQQHIKALLSMFTSKCEQSIDIIKCDMENVHKNRRQCRHWWLIYDPHLELSSLDKKFPWKCFRVYQKFGWINFFILCHFDLF